MPVATQHHAQTEGGEYTYGYSNVNSAKVETKSADSVTHGSYSYVDANGLLQTANYVSDPVNGFRVAATNIPVAPAVAAQPAGQVLSVSTKAALDLDMESDSPNAAGVIVSVSGVVAEESDNGEVDADEAVVVIDQVWPLAHFLAVSLL